jgi:hypothetical protein
LGLDFETMEISADDAPLLTLFSPERDVVAKALDR